MTDDKARLIEAVQAGLSQRPLAILRRLVEDLETDCREGVVGYEERVRDALSAVEAMDAAHCIALKEAWDRGAASARADLATVKASLDTAVDALDSIAPRPWEAVPDGDPDDDDAEWSIEDANGERVQSRWGSWDGQTNGEWARTWVASVNALPHSESE